MKDLYNPKIAIHHMYDMRCIEKSGGIAIIFHVSMRFRIKNMNRKIAIYHMYVMRCVEKSGGIAIIPQV